MLIFIFETGAGKNTPEVSGFSRGHMSIAGPWGEVTSKGKHPDKSLMIFPSIVELLDGVRGFLMDKNASRYLFVATDSSFQFLARRDAGERIEIWAEGNVLDIVEPSDLAGAVWSGLRRFTRSNGYPLKAGDPVIEDLKSSTEEFRRSLGLAP